MDYCVSCGTRTGRIAVPASKSYAHRLLISAALGDLDSEIVCDGISKDIQATIDCLSALGARIEVHSDRISVSPINREQLRHGRDLTVKWGRLESTQDCEAEGAEQKVILPCNESGSTLRFLIPVVGALGRHVTFKMAGKLSERPLDELKAALTAHGMRFTQNGALLECEGQLTSGEYVIPGNISSQYISGLLFALPLLEGDSTIKVTGRTESCDYIRMTVETIEAMGIDVSATAEGFFIRGGQKYGPESVGAGLHPEAQVPTLQQGLSVEKDWSNAAFFVCMGAMSEEGIVLEGMNTESAQGDRQILEVVQKFGARVEITENEISIRRCEAIEDEINGGKAEASENEINVEQGGNLGSRVIDASTIPDLVPTIAALASVSQGETRIVGASRLRFKESDRLMTTTAMLKNLGADITETEDGLVIIGKETLAGGETETFNDHRIAMAAAVAACRCTSDVVIKGCECTAKSYPMFFDDLEKMEVK